MCYSAMLHQQYNAYIRATGAEMDFYQFIEIFGDRGGGAKITIPRMVERWFDEPRTDDERQVHELIAAHRAKQATKWQQEMFEQKKRLGDAERKLATKITKAAENDKRVASNKIDSFVKKLNVLNDPKRHASDGRIFPMNFAPIVVSDGGRKLIRLARYHCRLAGKPASVDGRFPGLYNARRDNIDRYWRAAFGTSHALMLVDSFYENVDRGGKNAVLHFVPKPAGTMLIACLYSVWTDPKDGKKLLSFAAITDDPPPEVAAAGHDRMIVNLKPENVDAWLTPQGRGDAELQAILSDKQVPFYEHEVLAA